MSSEDAPTHLAISAALTEEELFERLRAQRLLEQSPCVSTGRRAGVISLTVLIVSVMGLGVWGNVNYDVQLKLAGAQAEYEKVARALSDTYDENTAAAADLDAEVRQASGVVGAATKVSTAVNGFADPDALAQLAIHTDQLGRAIEAPAGYAEKTFSQPTTMDEYHAAVTIVVAQTHANERALGMTNRAIDDVDAKAGTTKSDITTVALTVPDLAAQIIAANRSARGSTRDDLTSMADEVEHVAANGGDIVTALTRYGDSARAVQASAEERTGLPAVQVAATVAMPSMPATVSAILSGAIANSRPGTVANTGSQHTPTTSKAPTGSGSSPSPATKRPVPGESSAAVAPKPSSPAAAPEAFAVVFTTLGPYAPSCAKGVPVGGGVAYGAAGTTKPERLNFDHEYTYQVTTASMTTVTWTVYSCVTNHRR